MWRGIGAPATHGAAHDTLKAVRSNRDAHRIPGWRGTIPSVRGFAQEEQIREQPDDGGGAGREARARDNIAPSTGDAQRGECGDGARDH